MTATQVQIEPKRDRGWIGHAAYDGNGNSPFAVSLARHLPTENIEILSVMKRVIRDVKNLTDDQQTPMLMNDLTTEIYLNLGSGDAGSNIAYEQEEAMFEAALLMQSLRAWNLYFQRFPNGFFNDMASLERERLSAQALAEDLGVDIASVQSSSGEPLRIDVSRESAETMERALGLGKEEVKAVQAALNDLGYNAGSVDGVLGNGTRRAIANYQLAVGQPSTGVVTAQTADSLGVELAVAESSDTAVYSSRDARRYDPEQLALIENDPRLLNAVRALKDYDIVYGFYEDRIFIGVLTWGDHTKDEANAFAEMAGGHMATLTSAAENQFAYELVLHDDRFWLLWEDSPYIGANGPGLGLFQEENAREPTGGWQWITGEPITFDGWQRGQPNNNNGEQDIATFNVQNDRNNSPNKIIWAPTWADNHMIHRSLIIEIE